MSAPDRNMPAAGPQGSALLAGKIALITGAGRGLGAETARQFAAEGARVAVNYLRNRDAAEDVVRRIRDAGGEAFAVQADVRDEASVSTMAAEISGRWGSSPDILVLNAEVGGFRPTPFLKLDLHALESRLVDEVKAAVTPVRVFSPALIEKGRGCILAVTSALCRSPTANFSVLAVSKGALEALVRALAVELGPHGIRVNAIEASLIEGENSSFLSEEHRKLIVSSIPLGRISKPADVAGVLTLAASDRAGFVSGATIPVNGAKMLF